MYGKIFASIYQGTLRGQAHAILVFTNLIACADRHGYADKHWRAIAEEVGLTVDEVRNAIAYLEAPDPESRSTDEDGARIVKIQETRGWGWKIVNYTKYREIRNDEDRRVQVAAAVKRHRDKVKSDVIQCNPPVSQGKPVKAQGEGDAKAEREESEELFSSPPAAEKPANTPKYSWLDWRREHPRIRVAWTGEDGDQEAWKGLWSTYGKASMDEMYATLCKNLPADKNLFYAQAAVWLAEPHPVGVARLSVAETPPPLQLPPRRHA